MRALLIGKVVCLCSISLLFCVLSYQAIAIPKAARNAIIERDAQLKSVLTHADQIFLDLEKLIRTNSMDLGVMVETMTVAARDSEELVSDLRTALLGGKDTRGKSHRGVTVELTLLLTDMRGLVNSLQKDINDLSISTNTALVPLQDTLKSLNSLTITLEKQVNAGSPEVMSTIQSLNKSVDDLDALLADKNIVKTIANAEKATLHTAQSMESVDMALRPWRQKAGLLKTVVGKLFTVFKFTWAF